MKAYKDKGYELVVNKTYYMALKPTVIVNKLTDTSYRMDVVLHIARRSTIFRIKSFETYKEAKYYAQNYTLLELFNQYRVNRGLSSINLGISENFLNTAPNYRRNT
jgi:hypothetical protein